MTPYPFEVIAAIGALAEALQVGDASSSRRAVGVLRHALAPEQRHQLLLLSAAAAEPEDLTEFLADLGGGAGAPVPLEPDTRRSRPSCGAATQPWTTSSVTPPRSRTSCSAARAAAATSCAGSLLLSGSGCPRATAARSGTG